MASRVTGQLTATWTAPPEGGRSGGRTPRSGAAGAAVQTWGGKRGGDVSARNCWKPSGQACAPPRARLTSTCLALKTMPCAPSPMRPRMQYWSMPAPPRAPPLPAGPARLPSNELPPGAGSCGRRLGLVYAFAASPRPGRSPLYSGEAIVRGRRNGAQCPLPAPPDVT